MTTTPTALSPRTPGYQFISDLPEGLASECLSGLKDARGYLSESVDDKTIIALVRVCKAWRDNKELDRARIEATIRAVPRLALKNVCAQLIEGRYPTEMVQLFQNCNVPIGRLPVLDLGERMGETDYIDFLEGPDMQFPIMRFVDRYKRPGIALHLEGYADGKIGRSQTNIRDISGVWVGFQRYTRDNNLWLVGMGGDLDSVMNTLQKGRHYRTDHIGDRAVACPNCPSGNFSADKISYVGLSKLLTGQDPVFRIAQGYIPRLNAPANARDGHRPEQEEHKSK